MTTSSHNHKSQAEKPAVELRDETLGGLLGNMPPRLLRWSAATLAAASAATAAVAVLVAGL